MELVSIGEFARLSRQVEIREVPERSVLCQHRYVTRKALLAVGKQFIWRFRDGTVPLSTDAAGSP